MGNVLTFYLNETLFGIDITLVKEINRNIEYTPVPDARPYIVGLLNMRGQIVTLFNLQKLMDYESESEKLKNSCIILKTLPNDPNQIGFLIDRLGDVEDINVNECEAPPANVGGIDGEYINGVVKLKTELLLILEPEKIFKK